MTLRADPDQIGTHTACPGCGHENRCPAHTAAHPLVVNPQPAPAEADAPLRAAARTVSRRSAVALGVAALALASCGWGAWALARGTAEAPVEASLSSADRRQAEILKATIDGSPDAALMRRYAELNTGHFGGRLPAIPVMWEPRLAEVGPLSGRAFTLHGMFGHIGDKAVILLNPDLERDSDAVRRALSHEMVHASLWVSGDSSAGHGPAFQATLERLASEGAFTGVAATDRQREDLRHWLENEAARLDMEQDQLRRESESRAADARALEQALADLNARGPAAPQDPGVLSWISRRDAHNRRVEELRLRTERGQSELASYNKEVERYNLMLLYPDGFDDQPTLATRR